MKILLTVVFALLVASFSQAEPQFDEDTMMDEDEFIFKKAMIEKLANLHRLEGSDEETTQLFMKEVEYILDMEVTDDPELRQDILDGVAKEIGLDQKMSRGDFNPQERSRQEPIPA